MPLLYIIVIDLLDRIFEAELLLPLRVMFLEFSQVADVPDVVAATVLVDDGVIHFVAGDLLTQVNRLQNRTAVLPAPAHVVNFGDFRILINMPKGIDEIVTMDVVAHLFTFITEDRVFQKPVTLRYYHFLHLQFL